MAVTYTTDIIFGWSIAFFITIFSMVEAVTSAFRNTAVWTFTTLSAEIYSRITTADTKTIFYVSKTVTVSFWDTAIWTFTTFSASINANTTITYRWNLTIPEMFITITEISSNTKTTADSTFIVF
jgi:hypothetical protein